MNQKGNMPPINLNNPMFNQANLPPMDMGNLANQLNAMNMNGIHQPLVMQQGGGNGNQFHNPNPMMAQNNFANKQQQQQGQQQEQIDANATNMAK